MKSAVFYGKHDLRIEERALPMVGEQDVLIRVMACGICGTDVHIYEGDKGAADCNPNTVLGHEFSGVIEQIGAKVDRLKIGDRVCVDPNNMCGECDYCREGIGHFCEKMIGYGTTTDGGFAQYAAVPAKQVYRLADTVTFGQGAMAEPLACCLHGIDLCEIRPGAAAAVIGGGMIGLLMVQLAKLYGAHKVVLIEPVAGKREMGKQLGADVCVDPFKEDVKAAIANAGIKRLDAVIECAGIPACIEQAIDLAGKRSVVMMFGLTKPDATVALKPFEIFQKEVVLKASFINPYTHNRAVSLINSGRINVDAMVHDTCSLEALPEILSSAEMRAKGKYMINPWL